MKIIRNGGDKKTQLEFIELAVRYTYHARNDDDAVVRRYIELGIEQIIEENARRLAMTVADRISQTGFIDGEKSGKKRRKKFLH